MLKMKTKCEHCAAATSATSEAYICSYECTFCASCTDSFQHICPNCEGELVKRPTRTKGILSVAGAQLKKKISAK